MAEKKDKRIVELPKLDDSNHIYPDTYLAIDSTPTSENPGNIDQTSKVSYDMFLAKLKADLLADKNGYLKGIADAIYPVGSIYVSTDENFNPADVFGGTWTQIKDKFLLCSGDTYDFGTEGGAATVTLTGAQSGIKQHTHMFTQPVVTGTSSATISGGSHQHGAPDIVNGGGTRAMIGYNYQQLGERTCGEMRVKADSTSNNYVPRISPANGFTPNWAMFQKVAATTHTHSLPSHTHDIDNGAVGNVSDGITLDASEPHNNMPPYLAVNVWKRTE